MSVPSGRMPRLLFVMLAGATVLLFAVFGGSAVPGARWLISLCALLAAEAAACFWLMRLVRVNKANVSTVPILLQQGWLLGGYVAVYALICWWFGLLLQINLAVYALLHFSALLLLGIGMAASSKYADELDKGRDRLRSRTSALRQLQAKVESLWGVLELELPQDREAETVKRLLSELAEQLRFTDPISHPEVSALENSMQWQMEQLEECMRKYVQGVPDSGQLQLIQQLIADIGSDLRKREARLAEAKNGVRNVL